MALPTSRIRSATADRIRLSKAPGNLFCVPPLTLLRITLKSRTKTHHEGESRSDGGPEVATLPVLSHFWAWRFRRDRNLPLTLPAHPPLHGPDEAQHDLQE